MHSGGLARIEVSHPVASLVGGLQHALDYPPKILKKLVLTSQLSNPISYSLPNSTNTPTAHTQVAHRISSMDIAR